MLNYYKSRSEITKEFGISEGAIRNWIKKAQGGELGLQLTEINGKSYILKNQINKTLMKQLVEEGRKFRALDERTTIDLQPESVSHLSNNQLVHLIASLEAEKTIPQQFCYLNGGADYWEKFYERSLKDNVYATTHSNLYYFENAYTLIKDQFREYTKINVVDIGPGNAEPAIGLLKKLKSDGILNSYTAIDISQKMLEYARNHIEVSGLDVEATYEVADIESTSLQPILYTAKYRTRENYPTLILCLGTTLHNQDNILHTGFNIKDGMMTEDKLLITNGFASNETANYNFATFTISEIYDLVTWFIIKLGLTPDVVENELRYNEKSGKREFNIILKKDVELNFTWLEKKVFLYKHDRINIWKHQNDTFKSISSLADRLDLKLNMIIRNPVFDKVMYMMGKN